MKPAVVHIHFNRLILSAVLGASLSACGPSDPQAPPTQAAAAESAIPAVQTAVESAAASGLSVDNPAPRSETIISAYWEFTVVEVLRGEEALVKLEEASAFNGPPEDESFEYTLVLVHARYTGRASETRRIDPSFFDSAGSDGAPYDRPSILDVTTPDPKLQAELLTGGEVEGWVTVLARKDDPAPILVIQPRVNGLSTGPADLRYLSLAE